MIFNCFRSLKYGNFKAALFSFCCFMGACNIGTISPDDQSLGTNYYPLEIGHYVVYDIYQIVHNELLENDTASYQLKEIVADTFRNVNNEIVYRIERFTKDSILWDLDSVWTLRLEENARFIKTENNKSYIKLSLPLEEGKTWDGNAYNSDEKDAYFLENVNTSYQIDDRIFDRTISINQNFDTSKVDLDIRQEIYAENIGMVYKKSEIYQYIADTADVRYCQYFIVHGWCQELKYVEHGVE